MEQDDPFVVRSLAVPQLAAARQFRFWMGRDVAVRATVIPRSAALVCRTKLAMEMEEGRLVRVMPCSATLVCRIQLLMAMERSQRAHPP